MKGWELSTLVSMEDRSHHTFAQILQWLLVTFGIKSTLVSTAFKAQPDLGHSALLALPQTTEFIYYLMAFAFAVSYAWNAVPEDYHTAHFIPSFRPLYKI